MTEIKVCKFGGTSMADGTTIGRVRDIAKSDSTRRFFIVSAPGKRFGGEKKMTDSLLEAHDALMSTGTLGEGFEKIKRRFYLIADELHLAFDLKSLLESTEREILLRKSREFTASRGEALIAQIVAEALKLPFVDASELFCFRQERFCLSKTEQKIRQRLLPLAGAVVPGFYGADENGTIRTFSRGGGDISGAVVARAVHADLYENWTDVSGFLACDPRIAENPAKIDLLTFEEMRELSQMGACVLHQDAVSPVRDANIPVAIRNTFRPQEGGTTIVNRKGEQRERPVTGIAGGKNYILLRNFKMEEIFSLPFLYLFSEETKRAIVLDEAIYDKFLPAGSAEKTALVAIVGDGLKTSLDAPARIFKAVFQAGVSVKFSGFGASGIKFLLGVNCEDFERTVRAIYEEFYRNCVISP